ncbi:MAG: type II toxin-antitoxin system RelE/ParE family toxin [Chloroflexi bacterium]|nr:type II toxin-antitoxin system RelE/ParE family toxin [Chloroflexota bacterium]
MSANGSPSYAVRLRNRRVRREMDALREPDHRRVLAALRRLADQPRPNGCEKLYDDVYRVRVGDWRIIYQVDENNRRVEVGGIRRRSEGTYKGIEDLFS